MQRKQHAFASVIGVATCAILALGPVAGVQAQDKKADANGTWTWSTPGRDGGEPRKSTLTLKADGEKLTGKLSTPGRQGGEPRVTDISNGMIKGDDVSFSVTREFGGNSFTTKYNGKISGDSIKGKIEIPGRDGGNPTTRDWEAKREAEKK